MVSDSTFGTRFRRFISLSVSAERCTYIHFLKSHDVIKEKRGHIKYPALYYLLQYFLADKVSRTASRIALVRCTAVMVS